MQYQEGTRVYKNTDKRGRTIWYRWSQTAARVFRMSAADAEFGVAAGRYIFGGTWVTPERWSN